MLTSLKRFVRGGQQHPGERFVQVGQRRRLTPFGLRTVRPTLEQLEDRRVPSTFLELFTAASIDSYAGVGFRENQVATLAASVNERPGFQFP